MWENNLRKKRRSKATELREQLFQRWAAEFGRLFPDHVGVYLCPLCATRGVRQGGLGTLLTLEDVPPKSIGGRPLVLTCRECNSKAGYELESHLSMQRRGNFFGKDATRKSFPARMKVRGAGTELNVKVEVKDGAIRLAGIEGQRSPAVSETTRLLEQAVGTTDWAFSLSFRIGNSRRAQLALLKAAYLAAFARFGYVYILGKGLHIVREQLSRPNQDLIRHFVFPSPRGTPKERRILRAENPSSALVVQIDDSYLMLPWPPEDEQFYGEMQSRFPAGQLRLEGREYQWPTIGS